MKNDNLSTEDIAKQLRLYLRDHGYAENTFCKYANMAGGELNIVLNPKEKVLREFDSLHMRCLRGVLNALEISLGDLMAYVPKPVIEPLNLKLDYVEIKIIDYAINLLIANGSVGDENFAIEDVYNLRKKLDELEKN